MERTAAADLVRLITVGHGLVGAEAFAALLRGADVTSVVDVRTAPGSRRNPAFGRAELEHWLPDHGVAYRWERRLGGFRRPVDQSPNTALRHAGFRGYADHMRSAEFADALDGVVAEARRGAADRDPALASVMCSESVWWRCHRRLIADAVVLLRGVEVSHLMHDGRVVPHRITTGARVGEDGLLVYGDGADRLPGT